VTTTFFDGPPQRPLRPAQQVRSAPQVATAQGRPAPEPRHEFGSAPVSTPSRPVPSQERKKRNTRLAAIRAAAGRVAARQEAEIAAAAMPATSTATPAAHEAAPVAATATATATATTATAIGDPPPGGFDAWLEKKHANDCNDCNDCGGSGVKKQRVGRSVLSQPCPTCRAKDPQSHARMVAAMEADPARRWTLAELHELRGGTRNDCTFALTELVITRRVRRVSAGYYRWNAPAAAPAPPPTPPAPPAEEMKMPVHTGGTERLKERLQEAGGAPVSVDDLVAVYPGGNRDACIVRLSQLKKKRLVKRSDDGYAWIGDGPAHVKKARPTEKATPAKKAPAAAPPAEDLRARLLWLAGGHQQGYLEDADFINQVLGAIGFQE